jgi:DNA-binding SARP family transcriptional activator
MDGRSDTSSRYCRIEMLGGLRLVRGDEAITRFRTQKTAALLACLALYQRRPHAREELIERFWPEDDFETARHKLNVAVSSLRPQLEPPGVPDGAVLVTDRLSVGLNPAAITTDVGDFEGALAEPAPGAGDTDRAGRLQRALDLYRGPLLPGFYDDWIVPERQRLADRFIQALRRLTGLLSQSGDPDRALDFAGQAVTADQLREEAHAELIRLLAAAGQPAAALQQYREMERILADELGAAPSASTRDLAPEIESASRRSMGVWANGCMGEKTPDPTPTHPHTHTPIHPLEPVGGAVPLASPFYVERPADAEFRAAVARGDSIVLVKGARQVGKSSLLARGLDEARQAGSRVVLNDFQLLNLQHLESADTCLLALAESLAEELDLEVAPGEEWDARRGPNPNFRRYLRREVLGKIECRLVWGLDEVDRLFTCDFGSEIFGLLRALHNERALNPAVPWARLTLAIAYATEAHLFITDLNQSPFNVGTRLALEDFTFEQLADLNRRYGAPLREPGEAARFYRLVGGHPYLARRGLHEFASRGTPLAAFEERVDQDDGPFGDHLRRMLVSLLRDAELTDAVRRVLDGQPVTDLGVFYRLRSAGVVAGDSAADMRPRCQLCARYLRAHLG